MDDLKQTIEQISDTFGISGAQKTIFEIVPTQNPNEKFLNLKSGAWDKDMPWFGLDEEQNLQAVISVSLLRKLIDAYERVQMENFNLRLERVIWQSMPIDFSDVWAVAMGELKRMSEQEDSNKFEVDIEKLVRKIKKSHPNLFVNIKEIMRLRGGFDD